MDKIEILNNAFTNLKENIPITWHWETMTYNNDLGVYEDITVMINDQKLKMVIDIKAEVKSHQLLNIIENSKNIKNVVLVAEKLHPKIKEELRKNNVNYLESNGNVCIKNTPFFIYIDTKKTTPTQRKKGNRAFTKTGLKVVFHFLLNPQLINQTQRKIAKTTNVALGNIPLIINSLLENNYILKLNKSEYTITNYEELLNKWITAYAETLKPTIFKQRFKLQNQNWQKLNLNKEKTVWGGEPAGDIVTNHLRPEKFTLYTQETTRDLMLNYKLIPDNEGDIWVYNMFWNNTFNTKNIAPKELIYTDLILNNDKRSIETAKLIFDEYIQPNL